MSDASVNPETAPFRSAAAERRLLLRVCERCERPHWYPRSICPFCGGATHWREACGAGTLYSFSFSANPGQSRVLAFVRLREGPVMMSNVIDADPATLRIGDPVRVHFVETADGSTVPMFRPDSAPTDAPASETKPHHV